MNFRKVLVAVIFLSINSFAMQPSPLTKQLVQLSPSDIIKQRLVDLNLKQYVEATKIDEKLGGQKVFPLKVVLFVTYSIADYIKKCDVSGGADKMMVFAKPVIIKAILEEHPSVFNEIVKANL